MDGLDALKRARSNEYAKGLAEIEKQTPIQLSTNEVKRTADKVLNKFGITSENGVLDFSEAAIDKAHANKLKEVVDRISKWKTNSATGLNKLRQVIDGYEIGGINLGSSEKRFNSMVREMKTSLSDYLGQKVPAVAKLNKNFETQSEVIDNVTSQLKTGSADPNTALRKLLNVFNPKSTVYRPIVKELGEKAGKDLMTDVAAITMSKWTPDGLGKYLTTAAGGASLLNPAGLAVALPVAAASSPRIIGKGATTIGKLSKSKAPEIVGELLKAGTKTAISSP